MKVRKLLLALGLFTALSLAMLFVLPLLFRGRIVGLVKAELAERAAARVDWRRVRLSLLRDFPNATLQLERLTVVGIGPFEHDTLASIANVRVVLDLGSVLGAARRGEPLVIRSV